MTDTKEMPIEFSKIMNDFIKDIYITFPEYIPFIQKWRKSASIFDYITDTEERNNAIEISNKTSDEFVFQFCTKKYPPRYFDILYKNEDIFTPNSEVDTEFLPHIYFKTLWQCDITKHTQETMWKYLQLILFTITGTTKPDFNNETFNESDFKDKLEETLGQMQDYFNKTAITLDKNNTDEAVNKAAQEMDDNISGLLGGKLGNLAKEIAEETAGELNMNMDNVSDMNGVFEKLFKNPGKLMSLVKNVSEKLDVKLKDGDIKESELMSEVGDLISKMKNIPGMDNIHSMLGKMTGTKVNINEMDKQLQRNLKMEQMRERMKQKNIKKNQQTQQTQQSKEQSSMDAFTDEQLEVIFNTKTQAKNKKK
jgi:hypothetical protein